MGCDRRRPAVITGGSRGIGAQTPAAHGVRIVVTGRDPVPREATAAAIRTDPAAVERTRDRTVGRVPGCCTRSAPTTSGPQWTATSPRPFLALAAVLPGMVDRGGGTVVMMSSVAARRPGTGAPVPYSAAKSGVETLTTEVARRYGRYGIRANCVAPSTVLTVLTERTTPAMPRHGRRRPAGPSSNWSASSW